ncbi:hypothetical protein [Carnobacterium maltaromaticum]|uniref:hypothetical protein n=1 Tax=Carnobacterium maltaromaticum TaxID=2751 RepID=UPI001071D413|nr:hypothetical protein [Carnobacterium maltaromaticum]TFJ75566.1 hypothetical protein CKN94_07960 [Carnobacterium maltaromaticum]TFJ78735.1 hypothetical protein CKN97_07955 [Carnobacterium maltaromaticum]
MSECFVSLSDGEKVVLKISEKELFSKISNGDGFLRSRLIRFYNDQEDAIYINPVQIVKITFSSGNSDNALEIDTRYQ